MDAWGEPEIEAKPRVLPLDLPRSLNDRRQPAHFQNETEIYDAWQGMSELIGYRYKIEMLKCS